MFLVDLRGGYEETRGQRGLHFVVVCCVDRGGVEFLYNILRNSLFL